MRIGVIGFPQSGKTTLIETLAAGEKKVVEEEKPSQKKKHNLITLKVPDPRLKILADFFKANQIKPAEVSFHEITGLGTSSGLNGETLLQLKESDGLVLILRIFSYEESANLKGEFSSTRIFKAVEDE